MRLSTSLLVPALVGAASAASNANVYIFQGDERPTTSKTPTLTPEQARLVFAQRLGASRYHELSGTSESTLSYINEFGGQQESLFEEASQDKAAELVLIMEGVSPKSAEPLLNAWAAVQPAFAISNPPSMISNRQLVSDFNQQLGEGKDCPLEDAINPHEVKCWDGKSKVIHIDLPEKGASVIEGLVSAQERLVRWAKKSEMNTIVVLMPESSRMSKTQSNTYGSYQKASRATLGRRQESEEVISEPFEASSTLPPFYSKQFRASNSSDDDPLPPVPRVCHSTEDECIEKTKGCSGHGECKKKYGTETSACFTCQCIPQNETFWMSGDIKKGTYAKGNKKGFRIVNYGGAACQKKDISGPFWLTAIFTVVMIGLVSWAVGMLFTIGEEKLPGVIGAGVSSKAR